MKLRIDAIVTDAGTQTRTAINEDVVREYAERMEEGDRFPDIVVFHDGAKYYCADGFHRIMASVRCGFVDIHADVRKGTQQDALWFAIGANRTNGERRRPGDVRRAVELAIQGWPDRTQAQIALHVGCSIGLVNKAKQELFTDEKLTLPAKRKGADGKERPTTYKTARAVFAAAEQEAKKEEASEHKEDETPKEGKEDGGVTIGHGIDAMTYAHKATFTLTAIGKRDPRRKEALLFVIDWCKKAMRERK